MSARRLAGAALLVALLSLGLNAYLLWRLRHPEQLALPAVQRLVARLAAEDATVRYEVRLPAGMPIRLDIPVDERFLVRVDTIVRLDTRVRMPVRSRLGNFDIPVPLRADIPVRTALPLRVQHTFRLRTRTQDEIVVPLHFRLRDLPLDALQRSLEP